MGCPGGLGPCRLPGPGAFPVDIAARCLTCRARACSGPSCCAAPSSWRCTRCPQSCAAGRAGRRKRGLHSGGTMRWRWRHGLHTGRATRRATTNDCSDAPGTAAFSPVFTCPQPTPPHPPTHTLPPPPPPPHTHTCRRFQVVYFLALAAVVQLASSRNSLTCRQGRWGSSAPGRLARSGRCKGPNAPVRWLCAGAAAPWPRCR